MYDLRNLSDTELIDMLSEQTVKLTSFLTDPLSKIEYLQCKLFIQALTAEIKERRSSKDNQAPTDRDILLNTE